MDKVISTVQWLSDKEIKSLAAGSWSSHGDRELRFARMIEHAVQVKIREAREAEQGLSEATEKT